MSITTHPQHPLCSDPVGTAVARFRKGAGCGEVMNA